MKTLWDLVCARPNEDWNEFYLSKNMAININDIFANPNGIPGRINWNWRVDLIAIREDVTWEMIISDKNPWKNDRLFNQNHNITWKNIILSIDDGWPHKWTPEDISSNPNITWKIMIDNPYGPYNDPNWKWDFSGVCSNKSISFNDIYYNLHTININNVYPDPYIGYVNIEDEESRSSCALNYMGDHVRIEDISNNINLSWNWNSISFRKDLTWSFIKKAIDSNKDLNWYGISDSTAVTLDIIKANLKLLWSWWFVAQNPNITLDLIWDNLSNGMHWYYDYICRNPNINIDDIKKYSTHDMMIKIHENDEWNYSCSSGSPNIKVKDIINNPDIKWNYHTLSTNKMDYWFSSNYNRQKLANKISNTIKDELEKRVCHPSRHPATWIPWNELKEHPFANMTSHDVKELFDQVKQK